MCTVSILLCVPLHHCWGAPLHRSSRGCRGLVFVLHPQHSFLLDCVWVLVGMRLAIHDMVGCLARIYGVALVSFGDHRIYHISLVSFGVAAIAWLHPLSLGCQDFCDKSIGYTLCFMLWVFHGCSRGQNMIHSYPRNH